MPQSPRVAGADLVSVSILVDGSPLDETYEIVRIDVSNAVGKIPYARIDIADGDLAEETFKISESSDLVPGKEVEIRAGYREDVATIFKGVIVKHAVRVGHENRSLLTVTCRDKAIKMTVGRKNAYFLDDTDSGIIGKLIGDNGLQKDVEATSRQHKEVVQYHSSDWDFMVTRAEANGLVVVVDGGTVSVNKPDANASPALVVTYGDDIRDVEVEIDAQSQLEGVKSSAWDPSSQDVVTSHGSDPGMDAPGNITGKTLAAVLGAGIVDLKSTVPIEEADLKVWADVQMVKSRLSRIRGRVSFQGNATAKSGTTIALAGLGDRFNGTAYISGIDHVIANGDWMTTARIGLSSKWFSKDQPDAVASPASGLLPGIPGLQIGKVKKIYEDPDGESRIQVAVPINVPAGEGVWARQATFYATNNAGAFFVPEVDDEVVLGFLNDDPRYPVILGSLYSGARTPPFSANEKNTMKGIVTNAQLRITFEDEKKILTVETPGGHSITLSDEGKSISIADSNGNKVHLSDSGIDLESAFDLNIKASGQMSIQSGGPMSIQSDADLSIRGLAVVAEADTDLTAQGQASATLKASGQVTVQGAMVMIN